MVGSALLILATGCVPIVAARATDASAWRRIETDHIALSTDLESREARGIALELERTYLTLQRLAFPYPLHGPTHVEVVVFGRRSDYLSLRPEEPEGFFSDDGLLSLERVPTLVFWGRPRFAVRAMILHELTHWFLRMHHGQAPSWIHEGLADYFSTMEIRDDEAVLGRKPGVT